MTNKEIAGVFNDLAKVMELHQENIYKVRSYQNAYRNLRKYPEPLSELSIEELSAIQGIGKAISQKIREIVETGTLKALDNYREKTPPGVIELLEIKGIGPKKVRAVWKELGVESPGELWYACNENRLVELKGFGKKTQADLLKKLEFYQRSRGKHHYASLEETALELLDDLRAAFPGNKIEPTGPFRRRAIILDSLDYIMITPDKEVEAGDVPFDISQRDSNKISGKIAEAIPVTLSLTEEDNFGLNWFKTTGNQPFVKAVLSKVEDGSDNANEASLFKAAGIKTVPPELREDSRWLVEGEGDVCPGLVEEADIRGLVHCHTTYSDGMNSLEEMADAAKAYGLQYMVLSDHSQSAFYANGLPPERIQQQWEEIDRYNAEHADFYIFKGIESDILSDGSLDYTDDLLEGFDCIIASVHSNLKMDKEKATQRLLRAIENPFTKMLGHPTGRLLLSREGYPLDHERIIEACAAHGVCIELNANPYRLDLDWSWIPVAMENGVKISINPDAHSTEGIKDIHFGVLAARKGGLTNETCLNTLNREEFGNFLAG